MRDLIERALSFEGKFAKVVAQEDAIDLTEAIIQDLVKQGWEEERLRAQAGEGFRYSPSRNTLLGPVFYSDDDH